MDNPANTAPKLDPAELEESETPIAVMNSPKTSAEGIPATKMIEIADSGHFFPINKPAETAAALHEWFQSLSTAPRGGER